jgi:hypothetical protein
MYWKELQIVSGPVIRWLLGSTLRSELMAAHRHSCCKLATSTGRVCWR